MKVDYNPQVGYRRTIFKEAYDFLLKPVSFSAKQDGLPDYSRNIPGEISRSTGLLSD